MSKRVAIAGASGRMGRALLSAIGASEMTLGGATVRPGDPLTGGDIGQLLGEQLGIPVVDSLGALPSDIEVLIDFTAPEATCDHLTHCVEHGIAMVVGTTGFSEAQRAALQAASSHIPLCVAANFSIGVNLLLDALSRTARLLGEDFDIEIIETHHRHKVDAPSGTALAMGHAVANALGRDFDAVASYGREGQTGPRDRQTIGFSTIRGGDIVGEHTVLFAGEGERIEISHKASSRMAFAAGAVRAAGWLLAQPPGYYDMQDVLGIGETTA